MVWLEQVWQIFYFLCLFLIKLKYKQKNGGFLFRNINAIVSDAKAVWSDLGNFARHCFGGSLRLANDDAQDDFDLMMTFLVIWMLIFNDDGEDHFDNDFKTFEWSLDHFGLFQS